MHSACADGGRPRDPGGMAGPWLRGSGRPVKAARNIRVRGVVQGVGFRPFVFRLARTNALTGWVSNEAAGVAIQVEGEEPGVQSFLNGLALAPPPAARITAIDVLPAEPAGLTDFIIRHTDRRAA